MTYSNLELCCRASAFPRERDGARIQMRLCHSPFAQLFFFLVQWADCNLASTLGLVYILIYKIFPDGTTTMCTYERKASLHEFYAVIFPSLQQLHGGITEVEEKRQKASCLERYQKKTNEERSYVSEIDLEREQECGICFETKSKVVLPNCGHAMCINCFRDWNARSESCPFCRDSLKRVDSTDLWMFTSTGEVIDQETLNRENLKRLFNHIEKLPLVVPESVFYVYDSHYDSYMK
eukprot:TRINITY_DN2278_c0_g1_i4.p1 TRINITY_DN2278_c0_g1~~TRINITY_DN2278_c0_g1_i4.p1  ORF type:complete len:256 (-),score=34.42 TRINITY_DN2278_c0_g1_i4:426-1133(-)